MNKLIISAILLFMVLIFISVSFSKPPKKRPNILFAISDDQSDHTSFTGSKWVKTPAFDRIATEGVYFTNCYAGSPGCAPSRSTIVTGRHHWQNEQAGQHFAGWPEKYVSFVDMLSANGYHTGYTGKGVDPFKYGEPPLRELNAAGKSYNEIRYGQDGLKDDRFADGIGNIDYFANFRRFLDERKEDEPFFFWYGALEPHRVYEKDSWKRHSKSLESVNVPEFLPDTEEIRGDLLDYAVEIEWFDLHLGRMIDYLEQIGELENTIIIVTSDNGMPFPRAKANAYEFGIHVPLAIRFPEKFPAERQVEDFVSFVDFAPTILELTETSGEGMLPITGKSLVDILVSDKSGEVDLDREFVLTGRERHSSSRYMNLGYPQRTIRKGPYLLIWNMKPDRWPAGAPQQLIAGSGGDLYPMYGIDKEGKHQSGWAFTEIDGSPTKAFIVEHHGDEVYKKYFDWAMGKRPEFELYNVVEDPDCVENLADNTSFKPVFKEMKKTLKKELEATEDPRIVGPEREIFDTYPRHSFIREFPKPD